MLLFLQNLLGNKQFRQITPIIIGQIAKNVAPLVKFYYRAEQYWTAPTTAPLNRTLNRTESTKT